MDKQQSIHPGVDNDKMNHKHQSELGKYKGTMDSAGEDVKDLQKLNKGSSGSKSNGVMHTSLMNNWTKILESMDEISNGISELSSDPMNSEIPEETSDISQDTDEKALMDELNQIFTPILVMQGFDQGTVERIHEAMDQSSFLTEKNILQFDDSSRMAQLIAVCALLISKQKNSPKFQTYQKAATIRNQMKLEIQKDEYDEAKELAQKYLVNVATSNNSSVARNAAQGLLPQTQH